MASKQLVNTHTLHGTLHTHANTDIRMHILTCTHLHAHDTHTYACTSLIHSLQNLCPVTEACIGSFSTSLQCEQSSLSRTSPPYSRNNWYPGMATHNQSDLVSCQHKAHLMSYEQIKIWKNLWELIQPTSTCTDWCIYFQCLLLSSRDL